MKQEDRIRNLSEKIYLLTIEKPRYKAEISQAIYRKEKKTIYPEIKKLVKKNWIKEVPIPDGIDKGKAKERANKRVYLSGSINPIFDSIVTDFEKIKNPLTDPDKKKLIKFLNTSTFKTQFVNENIAPHTNIEEIKEFLSLWCIYLSSICYLSKNMFEQNPLDYWKDSWSILGLKLIEKMAELQTYRTMVIYQIFENMEAVFMDIIEMVQKKKIKPIESWRNTKH